jgi:hypothetical protein
MNDSSHETQSARYAQVAGVSLLLMGLMGVFANFFVLERLVILDDATATVDNIAEADLLFRGGVAAFVLVILLIVAVPGVVGELSFAVWLLVRSGRTSETRERVESYEGDRPQQVRTA